MEVTTIRGEDITQENFSDILNQSEKTLLYFYPKNDTPGCTVEANDFTQLSQDFENLGTQIIGVSKDKAESHCKFIAKYSLTPTYISDPDLVLHKKFEAYGEKKNYGKTYMGVIRGTVLLSKDGEILHQWKNVRAKGHAQRVYDYLLNQ